MNRLSFPGSFLSLVSCCLPSLQNKPAVLTVASLVWFSVCGLSVPASAQKGKPDPNVTAAQAVDARLAETAAWADLFNGKDLSGWKGDTAGYVAQDGLLVCKKGAKLLLTEKEYSDFAFQFDFKLEPSGNNGIGIRVPEGGHPSTDGMEIQILDHDGDKYSTQIDLGNGKTRSVNQLKPWQYHGSVYGIYPAKTGYLKPVGEWNTQTIVAIDDHIIVILNGAVIVDVFLDDQLPIDGKAHPGKDARKGHLVLAGHNDRVEFKNLRIADYSVSPPRPQSETDNTPPAGFVSLFNGQDLSGWKGLADKNANKRRSLSGEALATAQAAADEVMQAHWSVVEGVLTYDGKGQSLCTDKDYGDFELYVDWKIPAGADSGLYLRGTPQVQIWDPWDPRVKPGQSPPADPQAWVAAYTNGRNLGSGGLWNNRRWRNAPTMLADNPPGQWNTFFIRMVGEKVSIWLNEKLIVDRVKLENYWDRSGKQPLARDDQIELQHHGSELFFKNIYLRQLPY
ncbi:3-keto-disaccharide hydrolase [Rosistilla oblonga]|uniref:3-keto-disaccharide hydrolase n=1 Tax=Rosistilla oblonga TaxID=2527990 RepID=UPI003A982A96